MPVVATSAQSPEDGYGQGHETGLIWDSWEVIEENLREEPPLAFESALPSSVNLKDIFPTPGNQGRQSSCVAWAVAYALRSHQEEVKQNWGLHTDNHLFSPGYVYNQINDGANKGTQVSHAMDILVYQGVSTLASFPYDESDYLTQPTAAQKMEATYFRVAEWYTVSGRDSIKRRLADGEGVVVGIVIFPDFDNINLSNPIYDVVNGTSRGAHAVCLIGYDDEKGAFEFINSWGAGWGLGGYGWISYDLMDDTRVSHHGASFGYVMDSRNDDSIIYEEPFDYTVSNDKTTIIRCVDFGLGGDIVIPETLGGYPVTAIGNRAFQNSTSITGVVIPDGVTSIGDEAFSGCTSLTGVVIPNSVTYIGSGAFSGCTSLPGISVGANNPNYLSEDGVLFNENKTTLIQYPAGKLDLAYDVPGGVTSIDKGAFFNCKSLTGIVIPNSVKSIGSAAFSGLPDDAIIYVPGSPIKKLVANSGFPADRIIAVTEAGTCGDNLTWELKRESGTLTISGTGDMWNYTVFDTPWSSFSKDITKVVIGNGVTSIGNGAFAFCYSLTSVNIPDSVTSIGGGAFESCASLTSVDIPDSVTSIGGWAFCYCTSLTDVVIGDGVTSIGSDAFRYLRNTVKIYVPNQTIKTLVANSGFPMARIIILVDSGACGDDLTWELDTEGTLTVSGTGDMWDYTSSNAPWYSHRDSIKKVVIENGVTSIGAGAFDDCGIETLMIDMPTIGSTFAGMSTLKTVTVGDNLTSVAANAFSGLHDTAIIYVPNQTIKTLVVDSVFPADRILWAIVDSGTCGDDLTWELDSEGTLTISGTGDMMSSYYMPWYSYLDDITKVVIENGVTSIGINAFSYCASLTSVVIPDSVTRIDLGAFDGTSLTIHCNINSYAHDYAIENGIPFLLKNVTLEGTVTIAGSYVFGQILTVETGGLATVPAGTDKGMLFYQWTRDGTDISGATGAAYTLAAADVGTVINVTVEAANCEGSVTSENGTAVAKADQTAPVLSYTVTGDYKDGGSKTIRITQAAGTEYKFGNGEWSGNNEYVSADEEIIMLSARLKETATHRASNAASMEIDTADDEQDAPAGFTLSYVSVNGLGYTLTIPATTGAEYSFDGETWSSTNTKSGCRPGERVTGWKRMAAKPGYNASDAVSGSMILPKFSQNAPNAPSLKTKTRNSVTLNAIAGAQYRRDNGAWQSGTLFTRLSPGTTYRFYVRMKATATHEVSPSSTPLTVTTDKRALSKPKGLKLTAKKAKWKKVSNNNGYILKIMQGKKVIKVVQIKKGKTSYKIPKGLFKKGKRYIFTLVAKGRDNYKNSKTAKSKSVKIKK